MKLKKLEIQGFKTFVEPVSFNFEFPIIAIIGPNGSGKSNIVDAMKWCMGEQSTRQLRANQMSDLIFNGSEHRKSVGVAEVSLCFSGDGADVSSAYGAFSEAAVTRRMYRGEESEYYLNKDPRRLKDVMEFLMDIGISSKAFSIIEQGQIGEIIEAKPEMRRYVIEEAAGILKYKNRKKVALDKIELTRANLGRINDLLSEIKRQLAQVNRQVKVAQEYKALKDEHRTLDLRLLKTEHEGHRTRLEEKQAQLDAVRFDLARLSSRATARYADSQRFKDRLDGQASAIADKETRIGGLKAETMVLQEKIESARRLRETLGKEKERIAAGVEELEGSRSRLKEQLGAAERAMDEEKGGLDALLEASRLLEEEKDNLSAQLAGVKSKIEEERDNEYNRVRKISEIDNQITSAERDFEHATNRIEKIQHDRQAAEQRMRALGDEMTALARQEEAGEAGIGETAGRIADLTGLSAELDAESAALSAAIEQAKKSHEGVRSRCATLEDLIKNMDGYSEGTRYVIGRSAQFGIDRVLADYITVKPGYELAVQAVLGDVVQAMVVEDIRTAQDVIDALRAQDKGRAAFLIRQDARPAQTARLDGFVPLLDAVEAKDPALRPVFESLLHDVYIAGSIGEAYGITASGAAAVTMSGDVVRPGIVYGGSEETIKGGILDRRSELGRLREELERLTGTLGGHERRKADLAARTDDCRARLAESSRLRQDAEKQQTAVRARLQTLKDQLSGHENGLVALNVEEEDIAGNKSILMEEIGDLKQKKALYEEDNHINSDMADGLRGALAELEDRLEHKKDDMAGNSASVAAYRERMNAKLSEIRRIRSELEDVARKLVALGQEAVGNNGRIESTEQEALAASGRLAGVNEELQSWQGRVADERASYEKELGDYAGIEQEIKQIEKEIGAIKERESSLAIEVTELTMKTDYARTTAQDKYGVDIGQYDAGTLREEDVPSGRERLTALSEKITKMGDVNVGAIAEYEELHKRVEFYEKHKLDLEQAIDNLKKVINSINKESRKLFREVFDQVNEHFKQVIPRLFEGGRGELILTDEQDLLESGMEIVIQPQGKRLQNINLLSGGEKALSAVALLISVFMVRPSPFALLDEIDAPLDDASVGKLNNIVRELSAKSQFLLITHNKRTIQIADAIYGITMEEPGVSKVLSVKLQKEAV